MGLTRVHLAGCDRLGCENIVAVDEPRSRRRAARRLPDGWEAVHNPDTPGGWDIYCPDHRWDPPPTAADRFNRRRAPA